MTSPPTQARRAACSVVIAAHDERRLPLLERAVLSASGQSGAHLAAVEVVVAVDNNPGLLAVARRRFPQAVVVLNDGPRGASATRNTGARAASGSVLAFLDDDAEARPGWLDGLVRPLLEDSDVIGVGGRTEPDWELTRPAWFPMEFGWVVGATYDGHPAVPHVVRNAWSENMAVRAHDFWAAGGFLDGFGKVLDASRPEDTELCIRLARTAGGHWWFEPGAVVRHRVPKERSTLGFFVRRCRSEGRGKAALAGLTGTQEGLSAERAYVRSVLPHGLVRGLADPFRGRPAGLRRAAAIVLGLLLTVLGYAEGRARRTPRPAAAAAGPAPARGATAPGVPEILAPARTCDVDLSGPVPGLGPPPAGEPTDALVTVSLCGRPIGMLVVPTPASADELTARISGELGDLVATEAAHHGVRAAALTPAGLVHAACPVVARRRRLARSGPGITVIVCTRNRPEELRRCLGSVIDLDYADKQIVVVDNAPEDDRTEKVCRDLDSPRAPIDYVSEPTPGLSHARNVGLHAAQHPIVAFVDDDEVVDRHWLSAIAGEFEDPEVAAVTGLVLPAELVTPAQVRFEQCGGHSKGRGFARVVLDRAHQRTVQSPAYPRPTFGAGANMAFRLRHLVDVGGFDVALGAGTPVAGGEDTLALAEVMLAGYTLVYTPAALTRHFHRDDEGALDEVLRGYRRGLGAYYAALLRRDPHRVAPVARAAGQLAVRSLRDRSSAEDAAGRPDALPDGLARDLTSGVASYLREARRVRRARQ